jgi:hypothetical protein
VFRDLPGSVWSTVFMTGTSIFVIILMADRLAGIVARRRRLKKLWAERRLRSTQQPSG